MYPFGIRRHDALAPRFLTALMVRLGGGSYLFDAGEGAQINLRRAGLGIKSLAVIAVSHLHADHCLGIPGLLMLRSQVPDPGPLVILGPAGIKEFVTVHGFKGFPLKRDSGLFLASFHPCLEIYEP